MEGTMTSAIDVAAYIAARNNTYLDNRSLQKLVYFSNAWALGWTGHALVSESFEAWPDGPVDRELWKCQRYGVVPKYAGQLTEDQASVVDAVLAHYQGRNSEELVELSHEVVWREARGNLAVREPSRRLLSQDSLLRYYVEQAIAGHGPQRAHTGSVADPSEADEISQRVIERWRDGLDLLAQR
jgi:uncharacterized phage-associated protein